MATEIVEPPQSLLRQRPTWNNYFGLGPQMKPQRSRSVMPLRNAIAHPRGLAMRRSASMTSRHRARSMCDSRSAAEPAPDAAADNEAAPAAPAEPRQQKSTPPAACQVLTAMSPASTAPRRRTGRASSTSSTRPAFRSIPVNTSSAAAAAQQPALPPRTCGTAQQQLPPAAASPKASKKKSPMRRMSKKRGAMITFDEAIRESLEEQAAQPPKMSPFFEASEPIAWAAVKEASAEPPLTCEEDEGAEEVYYNCGDYTYYAGEADDGGYAAMEVEEEAAVPVADDIAAAFNDAAAAAAALEEVVDSASPADFFTPLAQQQHTFNFQTSSGSPSSQQNAGHTPATALVHIEHAPVHPAKTTPEDTMVGTAPSRPLPATVHTVDDSLDLTTAATQEPTMTHTALDSALADLAALPEPTHAVAATAATTTAANTVEDTIDALTTVPEAETLKRASPVAAQDSTCSDHASPPSKQEAALSKAKDEFVPWWNEPAEVIEARRSMIRMSTGRKSVTFGSPLNTYKKTRSTSSTSSRSPSPEFSCPGTRLTFTASVSKSPSPEAETVTKTVVALKSPSKTKSSPPTTSSPEEKKSASRSASRSPSPAVSKKYTAAELKALKVVDLKELLKGLGQKTSGLKAELVKRIIAAQRSNSLPAVTPSKTPRSKAAATTPKKSSHSPTSELDAEVRSAYADKSLDSLKMSVLRAWLAERDTKVTTRSVVALAALVSSAIEDEA
ncbi:hypothetical protein DIPPA_17325 [Diplonema papillatum]|nr:hypothetical protein DIPPA_17325 [Diplonema papillatum]